MAEYIVQNEGCLHINFNKIGGNKNNRVNSHASPSLWPFKSWPAPLINAHLDWQCLNLF